MSRLFIALCVCSLVSCSCPGPSAEDGGPGGGAAAGSGGGSVAGGAGGGSTAGGTGGEGGSGGGAETLTERPPNPTCLAPAPPPVGSGVKLTAAWNDFDAPLGMKQAPGDSQRVFVQERAGRIRVFNKDTPGTVTDFLNITSKVDTFFEGGFLSFQFHPQWPATPELYVSYTEDGGPLRSVIARYKSEDGGLTLNQADEERILVVQQPAGNHNGGYIEFGPDGFLYIAFGDGGDSGDPGNRAQRLNTLHGKMLRIDVSVPAAGKYAIPADNPYADDVACNRDTAYDNFPDAGTRCAEIYALGLRNPWRWSFDQVSGELWLADVGQGTFEEVDLIVRGGNYGWKVREGFNCYNAASCPSAGFIDPVLHYPRADGYSITGGYVYHGTAIPSLVGRFVFGDYGSGRIWAVESDGEGGYEKRLLIDSNVALGSFGLVDGELYALDLNSGATWRLDPEDTPPPEDNFPQLLSQTGCFDGGAPVAAMIPYNLNAPFWSDGADKQRHFALPDDAGIVITDGGDFDFPNGTVLEKTFYVNGQKVETRLFMRHDDGAWAGYSYEWNDAGTDAQLLPGAKTVNVGGTTWFFPSRAQCLQCHTAIAGRSLGLELAQLNRDGQLQQLEALGFFDTPLPSVLPSLEPPFGAGPLEARARSYLHSNCAICHQQGAGQGVADWRASLSFADTQACDAVPQAGTFGLTDARVIAPGDPARSVVSHRIRTTAAGQMPPVARQRVDEAGAALIDGWISSLTACP